MRACVRACVRVCGVRVGATLDCIGKITAGRITALIHLLRLISCLFICLHILRHV